ncbi:MAG: S8 family serine peptidase [Thioalkalivibrionaceae bacterium]
MAARISPFHLSTRSLRKPLITAPVLTLALILAACSGGDGGNDLPAPPDQALGDRFVISGAIRVAAHQRVDSDINDSDADLLRNNIPEQAQPVPNPVTIGGFVTRTATAGTGRESDRFVAETDRIDLFRADLVEGQIVRLEFPDPFAADLDLFLADQDGTVIEASTGFGPIEQIRVPRSGRFFIGVEAFSGRSNYNLRIGSTSAGALSHVGANLQDRIIPGEYIVTATKPETSSAIVTQATRQAMVLAVETLGAVVTNGAPDREMLVTFPPATIQSLSAHSDRLRAIGLSPPRDPEQAARLESLLAMKALRNVPGVGEIEPNRMIAPLAVTNDPLAFLQWYHDAIRLPEAWQISTGRPPFEPVVVAVVDTGIFASHEDLRPNIVPGFDFIRDPVRARDGDGIDPDPDDPGDSERIGESTWHGTHVAGIIGASTDNAIGVAGVSQGVQIMPVRVLGLDGGTAYDVLQGVRFAAGLPNDSGRVPGRRADVINLSIGSQTGFSAIENQVYELARANGSIVVAAAGNSGRAPVAFPAAYRSVIAVGATDARDVRAPYSSFGPELDLVAPGGNLLRDDTGDGYPDGILSTSVNDLRNRRESYYQQYEGTSMAAAIVSGVFALARSIDPRLQQEDIKDLLAAERLTDDVGPVGRDDEHGWGRINALKTLSAVQNRLGAPERPPQPVLSVRPGRLDFGLATTERVLDVENDGTSSLGQTRVFSTVPWLRVFRQAVDDSGLGTYLIRIERTGLAIGPHIGFLEIRADNAPVRRVRVEARVAATSIEDDTVGRLYVHLVDDNDEVIDSIGIAGGKSEYPFQFTRVPPGSYRLIAGTDMDNDGMICDPGEACGAWPTLGLIERLSVDRDRENLRFTVGFDNLFSRVQPSVNGSDSLWGTPTVPEPALMRPENQRKFAPPRLHLAPQPLAESESN